MLPRTKLAIGVLCSAARQCWDLHQSSSLYLTHSFIIQSNYIAPFLIRGAPNPTPAKEDSVQVFEEGA